MNLRPPHWLCGNQPCLSDPPVTTQRIICSHLRRNTLCWETELWVFKCYQFQIELGHPFLQNADSDMTTPPDSRPFTLNQGGQKFEFVASDCLFFELEWFSPDVGKDIFQLGSKDYTCIQACMYTYIHTYIHTKIQTYMHTYIYIYKHTYIHMHTHTYIYTYIDTHMYTHF